MSVARAILAAALVAGCAEIVGVRDLPGDDAGDAQSDAPNDAPITGDAPACAGARVVISSQTQADAIAAAGGFVYAQLVVGLARCAADGACADPPNILGFGADQDFEQAAVANQIAYTLRRVDATSTSVHLAALDGSGDQLLVTSPAPAEATYVAFGGAHEFWMDASTGETHCAGCTGPDSVWMTTGGDARALLADANAVYVLDDDDQLSGLLAVYSCATSAPCATNTRVTGGLDLATSGPQLASDGAKLYVAPLGQPYVAAYDAIGDETDITSEGAQAIAVDATTGDLFYAADDGTIDRVKTDGSKIKTALTGCALANEITALAFDATNVYALVTDVTTSVVYAVPRK